jgi:cytochrome P450
MGSQDPVHPELHPPRWAPTFVRWQRTRIGWIASWRLALRGLWAGYRHTIFDYATQLPGQDDIMVARAPLAKFVVVRNPDIARHILVTNQDNYAKSAEYDLLAVAFGRGLVTDLDDELWQRNRRLVQPIFAKQHVDAFGPSMTAAAVAAAGRWQAHAATGARDAYTFDPARFSEDNFDPQLRRAHIPFGAGKRMCIASGFATREAILVIATLAQRFELDLVPGQHLRRELTFTGGPDGRLLMRPHARMRLAPRH